MKNRIKALSIALVLSGTAILSACGGGGDLIEGRDVAPSQTPRQEVTAYADALVANLIETLNKVNTNPSLDPAIIDSVAVSPLSDTLKEQMGLNLAAGTHTEGNMYLRGLRVQDIMFPGEELKGAAANVDICVSVKNQVPIDREGNPIPKPDAGQDKLPMLVIIQNPNYPDSAGVTDWRVSVMESKYSPICEVS